MRSVTRTLPVLQAPGLARRLLSMAYETLVVTAVVLVASLPFLGVASEPLSGGMRYVLQGYWFVVLGAYFVACWSRGGRTLPMQTWKIRVVRNNGVSIGVVRAMLRYALAWLSLLPLGAGFLWAFFDREGQFLHDRLAGTRMIVDREAADLFRSISPISPSIVSPPTTSSAPPRRGKQRSGKPR